MPKTKKAGKASKKQVRKDISTRLSAALEEFIPAVGKKRIESVIKKFSRTLSRNLKKSGKPDTKKDKKKPLKNVNAPREQKSAGQKPGIIEAV